MLIHELAQQTGVSAKTIRYYEDIALLPMPSRHENNYRHYTDADVERLRFVARARSLGFALEDLAKILAARDAGMAPCEHVLATLVEHIEAIDRRIADMIALRDTLGQLYRAGATLPRDDITLEQCVCGLIKNYPEGAQRPEATEQHHDE